MNLNYSYIYDNLIDSKDNIIEHMSSEEDEETSGTTSSDTQSGESSDNESPINIPSNVTVPSNVAVPNNITSEEKQQAKYMLMGQIQEKLSNIQTELNQLAAEDDESVQQLVNDQFIKPLANDVYYSLYNFFLERAQLPEGPFYYLDTGFLWPECESYVFPYVNMYMWFKIFYLTLILVIIFCIIHFYY